MAALGADDDLRLVVSRIRERWPDVEIIVRGDSGFGVPWMYDVCDELDLTYPFGFAMNPRLHRESVELLAQAVQQYESTGQKQRLFLTLPYQAESWPLVRQVIIKCEAHAQGTQTPQDRSDLLPLSEEHVLPIFWYDHHMVLSVPLHVGLALPILHGGPPAPRGLPMGGSPFVFHSANGRALSILTARGGGLTGI